MPINPDAVGYVGDPTTSTWSSKDALLYAVGVGAGHDPLNRAELTFLTENSMEIDQKVLPTMAVVLGGTPSAFGKIGTFNPAMLVHGEEKIVLHREIPVEGSLTAVGEITAIWDKGKGAVVEATTRTTLDGTDEPLFDVVMSAFIRGEGDFGGERGPSGPTNVAPDRPADHTVAHQTRKEQAFVYRLSGDRNPLHSDPSFAALAGFDRPILHGLCTYGFAGRALLASLCDYDPSRFASMEGRFSSPVFPGEELTTEVWDMGDGEALFRTLGGDGRVVLDSGRVTTR